MSQAFSCHQLDEKAIETRVIDSAAELVLAYCAVAVIAEDPIAARLFRQKVACDNCMHIIQRLSKKMEDEIERRGW